jgi:hypothetical protein
MDFALASVDVPASITNCEATGRIEALYSHRVQRGAMLAYARDTLSVSTRGALTTNEIPLPVQYASVIRELMSEFGVCRRQMFLCRTGMGVALPPAWASAPPSAHWASGSALNCGSIDLR